MFRVEIVERLIGRICIRHRALHLRAEVLEAFMQEIGLFAGLRAFGFDPREVALGLGRSPLGLALRCFGSLPGSTCGEVVA